MSFQSSAGTNLCRYPWRLGGLTCLIIIWITTELRAENVSSPRFQAPHLIEVLAITSSACSAWDNPLHRCFTGQILVHHSTKGSTVYYDVVTYPLDRTLSPHLQTDFGSLAIIVRHKIYSALHFALLPEESDQQAAAALQQEMLPEMVYWVLPRVILPLDVEWSVYELARLYRKETGKLLIITSGTRTPRTQARAMYTKLARGDNLRRLYKKTEALQQVMSAFRASRRARKNPAAIISAMAEVLSRQMEEGIYLSPHLRAGAVDIRSRNMNRRAKRALQKITKASKCFKLNREERIPPHFHLEVYTGRLHQE